MKNYSCKTNKKALKKLIKVKNYYTYFDGEHHLSSNVFVKIINVTVVKINML